MTKLFVGVGTFSGKPCIDKIIRSPLIRRIDLDQVF
jgi:hypothetical protein